MAKVVKSALSAIKKVVPNKCVKATTFNPYGASAHGKCFLSAPALSSQLSRTHSNISFLRSNTSNSKGCLSCSLSNGTNQRVALYSSEVDKEMSSFLEKEIQYEVSRASSDLPKIKGFEIKAVGGDLTFTKEANKEKIVISLSVNGAVDSVALPHEAPNPDEPPQMVCRPPFDVELTKQDGSVLALQCAFPDAEEEESMVDAKQDDKEIEDMYQIQEVAFHDGEWKDSTYTVSAATMDAELFDLLMDMLDERGVNDEFIHQMVEYCTAYENKQYINFLKSLKSFAEK